MTVVLVCDRCQRRRAIEVNEMPGGWLRWPLNWPGHEEDVCIRCLTLAEQQALGELVEVER